MRFLKKYITNNFLTEHTENLSPNRYYIYTHIGCIKRAVKTHTPLLVGSACAGVPSTETHAGGGDARDPGAGGRDGPFSVLSHRLTILIFGVELVCHLDVPQLECSLFLLSICPLFK